MNPKTTQAVKAAVTPSSGNTGRAVVNLPRRPAVVRRVSVRPYSVAVNGDELRHEMRLRGLTGAELARRARVSPATISHAINGRRVHPAVLRKIATELDRADPMPGVDKLILRDVAADAAGERVCPQA